jgi:hypothetical protein
VDQNLFPRLYLRPAQEVQRARRAHEDGSGFLERHGGGFAREEPILRHARELRVGGELVAACAIDLIAGREPRHGRADDYCSPQLAEAMYAVAAGPKELLWLDTEQHIDLYDVEPHVRRAAEQAADFIHRHLSPRLQNLDAVHRSIA